MQDLWDNQCQNAGGSKSDWLLYSTQLYSTLLYSTSKKFQNRKRNCLAMILLDVFDHVREGQWERNQKMGYTNSQRIDKCSQIHNHVKR